MSSILCEKCGGEVNAQTSQCAACGAPVALSPSTGSLEWKRKPRLKSGVVVGFVAAGVLGGWLGATWFVSQDERATTPAAPVVVDLESVREKAGRGDAEAQRTLGEVYATGQGVRLDYKEAARWYRQAAEQGNARAQADLGELCEAGQGVPLDRTAAAQWFRKAAEQGDVRGQYNLAAMYELGRGVPENQAEAAKLFRLAADQGEPLAQYDLGQRYHRGLGVVPDLAEAYKWLTLAAARGIPDAATARAEIQKQMTREQIKEGQRRADAWRAKAPNR